MMAETEKEHLEWLKKIAKEARQKFDEKAAEFARLRVEVDALERDAKSLEQALDAARASLGLPTGKQLHSRFRGMKIKDAAEIAMNEQGGTMRTVDIVEALREGGMELGERAYSVVVTTLKRSDRFEKVDRGVYRLVSKQ